MINSKNIKNSGICAIHIRNAQEFPDSCVKSISGKNSKCLKGWRHLLAVFFKKFPLKLKTMPQLKSLISLNCRNLENFNSDQDYNRPNHIFMRGPDAYEFSPSLCFIRNLRRRNVSSDLKLTLL